MDNAAEEPTTSTDAARANAFRSAVGEEPENAPSSSRAAVVLNIVSVPMLLAAPRDHHGDSFSVASTADLTCCAGESATKERPAFLKSFTFKASTSQTSSRKGTVVHKLGVTFQDPLARTCRFAAWIDKPHKFYVGSVEEDSLFALSRIRGGDGDYLKKINGRCVDPSLVSTKMVLQRIQECLDKDGLLCICTKNKQENVNTSLVHATIIKPHPHMTCEELGLMVWFWGCLCIKEIKWGSIFRHSALKEMDQIISINGISCADMGAQQLAQVVEALPREVTVTALRRKERANGRFE